MIRGGEKILVSTKIRKRKISDQNRVEAAAKRQKQKKTRTIKGGRCDKCGSWWRAGVMKSRASYVGTTVPAQLCSTYQLSLPPCPPTPTHFSPRCPDFALSQQLCPTLLAPHELERLCQCYDTLDAPHCFVILHCSLQQISYQATYLSRSGQLFPTNFWCPVFFVSTTR